LNQNRASAFCFDAFSLLEPGPVSKTRGAQVQRRTLYAVDQYGSANHDGLLLLLNFVDGLYKLARVNWHVAYQILMTLLYVALSVRLIQLILAFRGE